MKVYGFIILASAILTSGWTYAQDQSALDCAKRALRIKKKQNGSVVIGAQLGRFRLGGDRLERRVGKTIGSGAHNNAHLLPQSPDEILIILQRADPTQNSLAQGLDESASGHLIQQIEYMKKMGKLTYRGHPVAPRIKRTVVQGKLTVGYSVEKLEGKDLGTWLNEGKLTSDQANEILVQVQEQVAILHSHGFVHGDINPSNILVSGPPWVVRLADFEPPGVAGWPPEKDLELLDRLKVITVKESSPESRQAAELRMTRAALQERWKQFRAEEEGQVTELRTQLREFKLALGETCESCNALIGRIRNTLAFGKEYRLLEASDFRSALDRLQEEKAVVQLRALKSRLHSDQHQKIESLAASLEDLQRRWSEQLKD